ncbi:MAG: fibronectin type III domain-containing protein [Oscillospiraceae bacterium]|nr:fibronectin type III domain-containing protein [Oscillospiraceae bacterium]
MSKKFKVLSAAMAVVCAAGLMAVPSAFADDEAPAEEVVTEEVAEEAAEEAPAAATPADEAAAEEAAPAEEAAEEEAPKALGEHSALKFHRAKGVPVAVQDSENSVSLYWSSVSGAEKYAVAAYDFETEDVKILTETTEHSLTITGLEAGKPYAYVIVPMVKGEWVEPSVDDVIAFEIQ